MKTRSLGSAGPLVGALGLGCMGMSTPPGPPGRAESIATIHAALDAGVTLIDTGDFYGMGHNEMLIGEALRTAPSELRDKAVTSVKFGVLRDADGGWGGNDGRPAAVRNFAAYSLQRLGVDHIDVYRLARLDPDVPIEETVGAVAELVEKGYVRHIGLSEVDADTIRRAAATAPICDVQIEYSLLRRGLEKAILPAVRELGISVTAYRVLSHGLVSGGASAGRPAQRDRSAVQFQAYDEQRSRGIIDTVHKIAGQRGVSVAQLAIAWTLSRGQDIVPLIGARTRERLSEALDALTITLDASELAAIERAASLTAGDREH
ncbi:aldo/keto reductase [Actinoplanes derwentensis]|uniref:Predicted oxidoreductase n=1 Tax=Actinoplanes derwentensis TaxID=113562 RepID=A0A1H2B5C6_9ACTN|nr:aldo/keto reductase [Actinoplanes derwentensis]GID87673.1 aldo/keto reductase [Actinoplanes derwentensis]SDT53388.1 Predicted oxidoreductase [Actinoplanes derwentensis]